MMMRGKRTLGILLCTAMIIGLVPGMMPGAEAEEYNLWVGDVRVTSENTSGNCDGGGTWSYSGNGTEGTLTLSNATINTNNSIPNNPSYTMNIQANLDLAIVLEGTNRLNNSKEGIRIDGHKLTIKGQTGRTAEDKLIINAEACGIGVESALTIKDKCTVESTGSAVWGILVNSGSLTIENSNVVATGNSYGIYSSAGGGEITNSSVTAKGGYGILAVGDMSITNSTVIATDSAIKSIFAQGHTLSIASSIIEATSQGYGIYAESISIDQDSTVTATGADNAIGRRLKNARAGVGWDNTAGTGTGAEIPASTEGQTVSTFKKVIFAALPAFSPTEGTYRCAQSVALSYPIKDATIYYTTDGSDPSTSSTHETYRDPLSISSTTTIKACAVPDSTIYPSLSPSAVVSATYTIHIHNWDYSSDEDTVTAKCTVENCPDGYNQGQHPISLVLNKPDGDLCYNGSAWNAAITGYPAKAPDHLEAEPKKITYYKSAGAGSTAPDGDALTGAPVDAGNYVAQITWGNCTAVKAFSVAPATLTGVTVSQDGALTYNGSAQTAAVTAVAVSVNSQPVSFTYCDTEDGTYTDTVPAFTDAGDHTVWYRASAPNHSVAAGEFTVAIGRRAATVKARDKVFAYTGEPRTWPEYDVTGLVGGDEITAEISGSITLPEESPVANEVKGYTFTAGNPDNYTVTTENGTLSMTNASAEITITAASEAWTYDGQAHSNSAVTVTDGELFAGDTLSAAATGSVTNAADTAEGNNPVADGYKILHGDSDVTDNYAVTTVAGTLTISRADPAVTAPVAKEGLVYTGSAQELVEAGTVTGGVMQYALGTDESTAPASGWSTAVPVGTEAGIWYVWYKVVGDANHNDTDPACVTVTIAAPEPEPPRPEPSGKMRPVLKSDGKKALQLTFTQMSNVDGYDVYLAKNSSKHFRLKKTLSADEASCTLSGLKMYTPYKVYIEAWVTENGGKKVVSTSETVYSYTSSGDGAETNLKSIKVKKAVTVTVDDTQKLSPKAVGEVEGQKVATRFGGFRYESSNPDVATVSSKGKVTGVKAGSCSVTITGFNGVSKNVKVTVKAKAESISFPEKTYKVKVGKKLKLGKKLVVTPSDAYVKLTWKSSKTSVATVDKNGVVTGVSKGTATITVKTGTGLKVKVKVKVK